MAGFDPRDYYDHMMVQSHYQLPWTHQRHDGEVLDVSLANALGISMADLLALIKSGMLPARKSRREDHYFINEQHLEHLGFVNARVLQRKIQEAKEKLESRKATSPAKEDQSGQ